MNTHSKLIVVKAGGYDYIMVYYSLNKTTLRINTKCKYIKHRMTKELLYNNTMDNYREMNERTCEMMRRVDDYISLQLSSVNQVVNQKECLEFIDDCNYSENKFIPNHQNRHGKYIRNADNVKPTPKRDIPVKTVSDYYTDFLSYKQEELRNRVGWKDYKSLQNALLDFQTHTKKALTFEKMDNEDFLISFRNFLIDEHPLLTTKGGMNDNTINKRIVAVKTFWKWLKKKKIYAIDSELYEFKAPAYDNEVLALTLAEIRELIDLEVEKVKERKLLNLFIVQCLTGLRYADLQRLNRFHFQKDADGDYRIEMRNKKTGTPLNIPIHSVVLELLKAADFQLEVPCNQVYNRNLKEIFLKYDLFGEVVIKIRKVNKEILETPVKKREIISTHTARRTYITNAIQQNVPLNNLMSATGHTQIKTVKKYIKIEQNKAVFNNMVI